MNIFNSKKIRISKLFNRLFYYLNKIDRKEFITIHARPFDASSYFNINKYKYNKEIAFLIQGPVGDLSFLIETIKLYRIMFPNIPIFVSTWDDINIDSRVKIEELADKVVISEKPNLSGVLNVNYQIVSTSNGLKEIRDNSGAYYVIKTRVDQRICNSNVFKYLEALLEEYPSKIKQQKERIALVNINTSKYRPYSFSDMFQFGHIDDLTDYWSCKLDVRETSIDSIKSNNNYTMKFCAENYITESYMGRKYIEFLGLNYENSLITYWQCIRDQFIVIDHTTLDLYWNKYSAYEYKISHAPVYDENRNFEKISFADWYLMQKGVELVDDGYFEKTIA
ncbi:WavE lipopolysaccharide synthesis family protein [Vibrio breoganii]